MKEEQDAGEVVKGEGRGGKRNGEEEFCYRVVAALWLRSRGCGCCAGAAGYGMAEFGAGLER